MSFIHAKRLNAIFVSAAMIAGVPSAFAGELDLNTTPSNATAATVTVTPTKSFNYPATMALISAAAQGDVAKVSAQLKLGADPAYNEAEAFRKAALSGQINVMKVLLDEGGIDPNIKNGVALLLAAMRGHDDVINLLLDRKMDPDGIEKMGRPLAGAAGNAHISAMNLLIKRGAGIDINNGYPIAIAANLGTIEGVKELLRLKADINAGQGVPLRAAMEGGSVEVVKYMLEQGADATLASVEESIKEISQGVGKFAAPEYKEIVGIVTKARDVGKLKTRVDALFIPKAKLVSKEPALMEKFEGALQYSEDAGYELIMAAIENNVEKIKTLIKDNAADPNFKDGSPLVTAADTGNFEAVKTLLTLGANINVDDSMALVMASDHASKEIVNFLIAEKINVFGANVELFLEQVQVAPSSANYPGSKWDMNRAAYVEIADIINAARKAEKPDYVPKKYLPKVNEFPGPALK